jgi:pyruvate/2-oxoacid:ferredoxin oxidoreductase beta subunit
MRESVTASALGPSPWLPVSYYQNPFSVSLFASLSPDASGITYKVQHTPDNPQAMRQPTSVTRVGTVATVVDPNHRLATGDCVMVFNSGDANLDTVVGQGADVTVIDVNSYSYVVANTGALVAKPTVQIITLRVLDHPLMAGTTRMDGNYAFPVMAVRVRITAFTAGSVNLRVIQGAGR